MCLVVYVQIFEKALEEPKYSKLYAQLCHRLCEDVPNFETPSSTTSVSVTGDHIILYTISVGYILKNMKI